MICLIITHAVTLFHGMPDICRSRSMCKTSGGEISYDTVISTKETDLHSLDMSSYHSLTMLLVIFPHHDWNLVKLLYGSHQNDGEVIATKFWICHDSCAVVACAKICRDLKAKDGVTSHRNCPTKVNYVWKIVSKTRWRKYFQVPNQWVDWHMKSLYNWEWLQVINVRHK